MWFDRTAARPRSGARESGLCWADAPGYFRLTRFEEPQQGHVGMVSKVDKRTDGTNVVRQPSQMYFVLEAFAPDFRVVFRNLGPSSLRIE